MALVYGLFRVFTGVDEPHASAPTRQSVIKQPWGPVPEVARACEAPDNNSLQPTTTVPCSGKPLAPLKSFSLCRVFSAIISCFVEPKFSKRLAFARHGCGG